MAKFLSSQFDYDPVSRTFSQKATVLSPSGDVFHSVGTQGKRGLVVVSHKTSKLVVYEVGDVQSDKEKLVLLPNHLYVDRAAGTKVVITL